MDPALVHAIPLDGITDVMFQTGYEDRLVECGDTLGKSFFWDLPRFEGPQFIPISAGGRIISPEEWSEPLRTALGLDECGTAPDPNESLWIIGGEATVRDLCHCESDFWRHHVVEPFADHGRASLDDLWELIPDPTHPCDFAVWRDRVARLRCDLAREVMEICRIAGVPEDGLYCRPNAHSPFEATAMMKEAFYCGCFNPRPMSMTIIDAPSAIPGVPAHRILYAKFDAESG
jgi:hypothetical protein